MDNSANGIVGQMLEHCGDIEDGYVVDIGANGTEYHSNSFDLIHEHGWRADLVEPLPEQFASLQGIHRDNNRVRCFNYAICPHDGYIDLYCHPNDGVGKTTGNFGASILRMPGCRYKWRVRACSFDKFLGLIDLEDVTLLAIDVEGYDYAVIFNILSVSPHGPRYVIT